MNTEELNMIRSWLINNIFRDSYVMFNDEVRECRTGNGICIDLTEVIATLYNLLHEEITGEPYDYMFHWANKCGSFVKENMFDDIMHSKE